MSRLRIPEPGDIYDRWDGESILVTGLVIDEEGAMCVEFETSNPNEPPSILGLGEWMGSARESNINPPPRRHVFAEQDLDAIEPPPTEPTRSDKQSVLDLALGGEPEPPTVGGK